MKKITKVAVVLLALALLFGGCEQVKQGVEQAAKGDIKQGAWSDDGKTFTNTWSGLTFAMPDGYSAATQEQIDAMMQAGMEATGQSGAGVDIALMRVVYDFMVTASVTGTPNVSLLYENVKINPAMNGLDEGGYIDAMKTQFAAMEAQGVLYNEVERGTADVGGISWTSAKFSINDVAYQRYYLRLQDDYMWQLIITYTTEDEADALVAAFTAA